MERLRAFRLGLKEMGYVEDDNVTVLYRWAENCIDRMAELAVDLAQREVAVLVTFGNAPARAAKAVTATVPIVFGVSEDPVGSGLVASLARPEGNLTGINFFNAELTAKRLELLRTLVPGAVKLAVIVDPLAPATETTLREVEAAAGATGLRIQIRNASTSREINAAFATFAAERPDAIFVGPGFLFNSRRVQLVHLATLHKVPATYELREFPEIGGLMSYGTAVLGAQGVYYWIASERCRRRNDNLIKATTTLRPDQSHGDALILRAVDDEASLALALGTIANLLSARLMAITLLLYLLMMVAAKMLLWISPAIWSTLKYSTYAPISLLAIEVLLVTFLLALVSRGVFGRELIWQAPGTQMNVQSVPDFSLRARSSGSRCGALACS